MPEATISIESSELTDMVEVAATAGSSELAQSAGASSPTLACWEAAFGAEGVEALEAAAEEGHG